MISTLLHFKRVAPAAIALVTAFSLVACRKDGAPSAPNSADVIHGPDTAPEHGFCYYGCPVNAPKTNRVLVNQAFAASFDKETKFSTWVVYKITPDLIGRKEPRNWSNNQDIPVGETLKMTDYINSRMGDLDYDRGHQAPFASLNQSPDAEELNKPANLTPQNAELNEGPWRVLEGRERQLLTKHNIEPHPLTGPLYERDMPPLPLAKLPHKVPSGYWKVETAMVDGKLKIASFIMEQSMHRSDRFCYTSVTLAEAEKRSNLVFFPRMAKQEKDKIMNVRGDLLPQLGCK